VKGWFQYRIGDKKHCRDCYQYEAVACCYTMKPVGADMVCDLFIKRRLTENENGYTLDHKE